MAGLFIFKIKQHLLLTEFEGRNARYTVLDMCLYSGATAGPRKTADNDINGGCSHVHSGNS